MTDNIAIYGARLFSGIRIEMMFIPPEKIAAAPTPATARPTISIVDDAAAAQSTEPSSKIIRPLRNVHLTLKELYSLPNVGCMVVCMRRYADPYQPTSSRDWKVVVIFGVAVAYSG